jgi:hypothetical protein
LSRHIRSSTSTPVTSRIRWHSDLDGDAPPRVGVQLRAASWAVCVCIDAALVLYPVADGARRSRSLPAHLAVLLANDRDGLARADRNVVRLGSGRARLSIGAPVFGDRNYPLRIRVRKLH